ncbi:plasmid recombination protein [Bacteroides sp. OttesenSCG-928-J23]|nr:plasmid recombination protein [Bacteroides sp. OttesenSCG-928-J23]
MSKTSRCVVRNEACRRATLSDRYRHNERRNQHYGNGDVMPKRSHLNIHFRRCGGSYAEAFDRMVAEGVVSTRGLGKDPKIVDEMVFDVNTAYFEEHGGYEYARRFFEEAYRLAVKEAGGEEYILSAVMHADERNKALSEKLGRDVFHYHLHVMYVPVVEKEVRWSKRCKDPALVGAVKEVVKQVSHSKKWPRVKTERGWINSYSLLQDRFHDHMKEAGFEGFDRGERGSTVEHLDVLGYKIKKDSERLSGLEKNIDQAETQLAGLQKKLSVSRQVSRDYQSLREMARKGKTGKILLDTQDWDKVCAAAKDGIILRSAVSDLQKKLASAVKDKGIYLARWRNLKEETTLYQRAKQMAPVRTQAALEAVLRQGRDAPEHSLSVDYDVSR